MKELKYDKEIRRNKIIIIIMLVVMMSLLLIMMTGCSTKGLTFNTYNDVTVYCYNITKVNETCGIEHCILLNVAEMNDNIKFSAEKNYLQCELQHCGVK